MNAKLITGITVDNFRGLGKLTLKGFGAVNLVVGQNNTGKTSILEAIAAATAPDLFLKLPGMFRANPGKVSDRYFKWLIKDGARRADVSISGSVGSCGLTMSYGVPQPSHRAFYQHAAQASISFAWWADGMNVPSVRTVPVQPRSPDELVPHFAEAVRSPTSERHLEGILATIDPRIRSLRLDYADKDPFISVDLGLSERIPLPQAGQGVYRMTSILSDLLGARSNVCLIDEIESGLHFSVLKQVWRGVAQVALQLGVQIFATTHSRECLEAAYEVLGGEDPGGHIDFAVIQLIRSRNGVEGRVLDEASIEAAVRNEIELR